MDKLLTARQVAELTGYKLGTIRQWVWLRRIEFIRLPGSRAVRFKPETLARLIARGTVRPARKAGRP